MLFRLSGYISSCESSCGRNSADRQFIYVNKRPVDFTKVFFLKSNTFLLMSFS